MPEYSSCVKIDCSYNMNGDCKTVVLAPGEKRFIHISDKYGNDTIDLEEEGKEFVRHCRDRNEVRKQREI